jgi:hypothetical protein
MPGVPADVLVSIAEILSADRDLDESLRLVCRELARATTAQTVSVYLLGDDGRALRPTAAYHVPREMLKVLAGASLPVAEQGFARGVFTDGRVAWTDDVARDSRFEFHRFRLFPHQSGAVIPLLLDGRIGGAFYLTWWRERRSLPHGAHLPSRGGPRHAALADARHPPVGRRRFGVMMLAAVARHGTISPTTGPSVLNRFRSGSRA